MRAAGNGLSKDTPNDSETRFLRAATIAGSLIGTILALLVLIGWGASVPGLTSFSSHFVPMAPSTAIAILLICAVLPFGNTRWATAAERIVFAVVGLLALSEFATVLLRLPYSIEHLAFRAPGFSPVRLHTAHVLKQMSPVTAGLTLAVSLSRIGRSHTKSAGDVQGTIALITTAVGILVVLGYAYGTPFLYAGNVAPVALTTGLGFAFLGLALIASGGAGHFPLRPATGHSARARMIRAFLPAVPAAILIDALLAALLPISTPAVAVSVFGLIIIVVVTGSIITASHALGKAMDRAVDALSERERELRAVFNGTTDALLMANDDGVIVDANRPSYLLFGFAPHDLLGQSFSDLLAHGRTADWPRLLRLRRANGQTRVSRADGSAREIEYSLTAGIFPDRHLVVVRDVTEQRRRQVESERLAAIVASSFDAIYSKDFEGTIVSWNPSAQRIFGYSPREVIGKTEEVLFPGEEQEAGHLPSLAKSPVERELVAKGKDLRRIIVTLSESPIRDGSGRVVGTSVIARDVTAHRQAELELQLSEARFMHMFEFSPVAIGLSELSTSRVLAVNSRWCELFGWERDEAVGRTAFELQLWADLTDRERLLEQLSKNNRLASMETQVRRKSGELRYTLLSMTETTLADSSERVNIVTLIDTTERRELELQLIQSQKMEAVGRLAGGVAHDFNNMLGVILGFSELLEKSLADGDRRKIEQVIKAAKRAAGLTNQLLAFSRKQLLEPKVINLNSLVSATATMLKRLIGEDISLETHLDEGLGSVRADPGQIEQVIMNLAVNARDAMPLGGTLTIATENAELDESFPTNHEPLFPGPYVMISVSDTGTGMDRFALEHLFEPFFTTKEQGKGTGLGLSTAYGIIKQSAGYVRVESTVGRGTVFRIFLPRVEQPAEEVATTERGVEARGKETILLAEDEESLRTMICEVLEGVGYEVLAAANGREAIRIATREKDRIRLLLTDVVMPGIGGPELAETLLADYPHLRVLFISGYTADNSTLDELLASKAGLLSKPFTNSALLARVRELLDAPEP